MSAKIEIIIHDLDDNLQPINVRRFPFQPGEFIPTGENSPFDLIRLGNLEEEQQGEAKGLQFISFIYPNDSLRKTPSIQLGDVNPVVLVHGTLLYARRSVSK